MTNWLLDTGPLVAYLDASELCQDQARPVIDQLQFWLTKTLPQVSPKTKLGQALNYLQAQWRAFIRHLDDGRDQTANNAIPPLAIGLKSWTFSNSRAGARPSANLYSLTEMAKDHGI